MYPREILTTTTTDIITKSNKNADNYDKTLISGWGWGEKVTTNHNHLFQVSTFAQAHRANRDNERLLETQMCPLLQHGRRWHNILINQAVEQVQK